MTQTELEAIASEYAESNIPNGVDENYSRSIIYSDGEMFGRFLRWLSERYEIVSKEKVREEYDHAKRTRDLYMSATCINTMENRAIDYSIGRMKELTTLFPQTLKSEK